MESFSSVKMLLLSVRCWVRAHRVLPIALYLLLSLLTLCPPTLCPLCLTLLTLYLFLLLCP